MVKLLRYIPLAIALNLLAAELSSGGEFKIDARSIFEETFRANLRKAEDGDLEAARTIAVDYEIGMGTPANLVEAAKWRRKAADRGDPSAQYFLAHMYYDGKGVPQDFLTAASWLKRSANQGYSAAQNDLGVAYANGKGVRKDIPEAYKWFILSAASKEKENNTSAANREKLARVMSSDQIDSAQSKAREWRPIKEVDPMSVKNPQTTHAECRFLKRHLPASKNWFQFGGLYMSFLPDEMSKKYGYEQVSFNPKTGQISGAEYIRKEIIKNQITADDEKVSLVGDDAC